MSSSTTAGSYALDQFDQPQREIERLRLQAMAVHRQELDALVRHGLANARRVLDAGCGSGLLLSAMAAHYPMAHFTGIDVNAELLALAAEQVRGLQAAVELQQGSILSLPPTADYDFVLSRFVMQHLRQPAAAVHALHGQLAPGGRLCLVDVLDDWFFFEPPVPALAELLTLTEARQAELGGSRRVGRRLPALLRGAGFTEVRVDVLTANSEQLGLGAFLELTVGFRPQLFAGQPEYERALQLAAAIGEQAQREYHFGLASAVVVSGRKE